MVKQESFAFWYNRMRFFDVDKLLFSDNGHEYTASSKFVYVAFVDEEKDFFKCGWSMHEDFEKMLGFLDHVFIPTAFYNWYDRHSEGFYIPMSDFDIVKEQVELYEDEIKDKTAILSVKEAIQGLYGSQCSELLHELCEEINTTYLDGHRRIYIKVYDGIQELKHDILETVPFEELFVEEMGMSIGTFESMCDNLENEVFFKKRLIPYLNNHMSIMF